MSDTPSFSGQVADADRAVVPDLREDALLAL